MKIAVWKTGHEIADMVAETVMEGLHPKSISFTTFPFNDNYEEFMWPDVHIGYGILRGMDEVFKACQKAGKPFFLIDRGYWKPGHYEGYYRISLNGTQQTFGFDKLEPDYKRWDALRLNILPSRKKNNTKPWMICEASSAVEQFFNYGIGRHGPITQMNNENLWWGRPKEQRYYHRFKPNDLDHSIPLNDDLERCCGVVTFNSSVGWEALRQGIPVVSDPDHSIVGAYQKWVDKDISQDYDERRRLFSLMAGLQLSLEEIRSGMLWPLINRLLNLSKST